MKTYPEILLAEQKYITAKNGTDYKVEHNAITVSRPEAGNAVAVAPAGEITIVTGITDDGYGHMDTITTATYQLPGQNTLDCEIADVTGGVSLTHQLKDGNGTVKSSIVDKYISENDNLIIAKGTGTDHEIKFNLVWGEF